MKVILTIATAAVLLCQAHAKSQQPSEEHLSGNARSFLRNSLPNGRNANDARDNGIFLSGATAGTPNVRNSLPFPLHAAATGAHYGLGPFSPFYSGVGTPYYGAAFNPLFSGAALAHSHYGGPLSAVPGLVSPTFPALASSAGLHLPSAGYHPFSSGLGFPGANVGHSPVSLLSKTYSANYGLPSPFLSTLGLPSPPLGSISSVYTGLGLSSPLSGLNPFQYGLGY